MTPNGQYLCTSCTLLSLATAAMAGPQLVVHEWGTFTSLQNETGRTIGGINTDDEPVPAFVHDLARRLLIPATDVPRAVRSDGKGALPQCHPHITMRLETPVIYFHPVRGQAPPKQVDVDVVFRGGWLTQFYPQAASVALGLRRSNMGIGGLSRDTISSLTWEGLKLGVDAAGPATSEHVWLAPRAVDAMMVQTRENEAERYLFYRGVGQADAPLRVTRESDQKLLIHSQLADGLRGLAGRRLDGVWLVDIRPEGMLAYRALEPLTLAADGRTPVGSVSAHFADSEYSRENLTALRSSMRERLVREGLYTDEAEAMLNTWEVSYFKSAGQRLFFMVPRAWTDHYLPLEVSVPAEIVRVMVGRIELVTPRQRELLNRIRTGPEVNLQPFIKSGQEKLAESQVDNVDAGLLQRPDMLQHWKLDVPAIYQAYLDLGRFRDALVLEEQRTRPTPRLAGFLNQTMIRTAPVTPPDHTGPAPERMTSARPIP